MIKDFLKRIFKNSWYKAGSLLLALIIWGIVQGEEIVEFNRRIKVNISVANGYAVKGKPYRYIDATLKGPRVILGEISNSAIEAKVYIPSGDVGNLEIPFEKRFIKDWDSRVKISVRDTYITVFVDEEITRQVDVREVLQGAPTEGYFIEKLIISPSKVTVTGIKSELSKLGEVITEPIEIASLSESKIFEVGLVTPQGLGPNAIKVDSVKVNIKLGDSKINKRFTQIPLEIVGSEYKTLIKPKFVSIVIQATPGVLSFVNTEDLRAFIEITDLLPGRYEKEIQVKIPPDTVLIETFPQKGNVQILTEKRIH